MEKFAVDLEKVLDEFEFSEEREERVALSVINNQSLPYISHVTQNRPPINNYRRPSFEPINLADADFAASPPRISHNHNQHNITFNNGSITNPVHDSNDKKSSSIDKYRQSSDDRLLLNGVNISNNASEILTKSISVSATSVTSAVAASDIITNTLSPPLSSSRNSVISESLSEEETSSLSDEKPDLLECNTANKSIVINEHLRRVGNDRRDESVVSNNDNDYYDNTGSVLPDVTSSVLPIKCINQTPDNLDNNNSCGSAAVFDLISNNTFNNLKNNNVENDTIYYGVNDSDNEVNSVANNEALNKTSTDNYIVTQKEVAIKSDEQFVQSELQFEGNKSLNEKIRFDQFDNPSGVENQLTSTNSSDCYNSQNTIRAIEDNFSSSTECNEILHVEADDFSNKSVITSPNSVIISGSPSPFVVPDDVNEKSDDFIKEHVTKVVANSDQCESLNQDNHLQEKTIREDSSSLEQDNPTLTLQDQAIGFSVDEEVSDADEDLETYLKELEELEQAEKLNYFENTNDSCCTDDVEIEFLSEEPCSSPENSFDKKLSSQENDFDRENCLNSKPGDKCLSTFENENIVASVKSSIDLNLNHDGNIHEDMVVDEIETEEVNSESHIEVNHEILNANNEFVKSKSLTDDHLVNDENDDVSRLNSFMKNSGDNYFSGNEYSCKISETDNALNCIIENSVTASSHAENISQKDTINSFGDHRNDEIKSFDGIKQLESVDTMGNSVDKSTSSADYNSEERTSNTSITSDDSMNIAKGVLDHRQSSIETIESNGEESEITRISRPNYLELPAKITVDPEANSDEVASPSTSTSPSSATTITSADGVEIGNSSGSPLSCRELSSEDNPLGKVPPFWVPDAEALTCMQCQQKFNLVKRRHHCRACGQVLCSKCCCMRAKLVFMEGEARVCIQCYNIIGKANSSENNNNKSPLGRQPNPNNPMEYCSTIPPLQQAAESLHQPPPSVLVPVGVLKREGRVKSEVAKQVMFSDGIRPGGDLTELDGSGEPRLPFRRPGRLTKRVGTPPGGAVGTSGSMGGTRVLAGSNSRRPLDPITQSFIPSTETKNSHGLPPIVERLQGENIYSQFEIVFSKGVKVDEEKPIKFAINSNLFVLVKRVVLDCCVNRECWCVTSSGLACVGQDEVILVLECLPDEAAPPRDVFLLINMLYIDASKGNTVSELSFSPAFSTNLLDSKDHGGFLYIRPSYQCTSKLILPNPPYLVALLIHKWETPWARLFPIRLVLRLGAEYRYYPCPLVSIRQRQPLYTDIGHTIINILADFRKYSYTLPTVRGLVVHMEDRQTTILLPRNRYDQVVRALNNSNDSVLAFGANLSLAADSHLVCIQSSDDENTYLTQAINIHNKPRRVTGASFVVFNGALKASCGLSGKSSIVEDGLMVQVPGDTMTALRTALRDMRDYTIRCGPHAEETVLLRWTADDTNFNIGVKSCIDGRPLDGVPSMRVHNGTDYSGQYRIIRWTEVFILQCEEVEGSGDPLDISKLSESLAKATCVALVPYLDLLATANLTTIGLRAEIHPDHVGYEAGSNCEKLPPLYMNSLDNELVAVVHQAAIICQDTPCTLELVFRVIES